MINLAFLFGSTLNLKKKNKYLAYAFLGRKELEFRLHRLYPTVILLMALAQSWRSSVGKLILHRLPNSIL